MMLPLRSKSRRHYKMRYIQIASVKNIEGHIIQQDNFRDVLKFFSKNFVSADIYSNIHGIGYE